MILGRWLMVQMEIEGFHLIVPVTYRDADPDFIDKVTGGCGPGSWGDYFVPDTNLGESIFLACRIHDWMYREGTTAEDKWWADHFFLMNMNILVFDMELLDRMRVLRNAEYYLAVAYHGDGSFYKGKI